MFNQICRRMIAAMGTGLIALSLNTLATKPVQATEALLTFSNAEFSNGGYLSGSIVYDYDATTRTVLDLVSVDMTVTSPSLTYLYNVPQHANTVTLMTQGSKPAGLDHDNNLGDGIYETYLNSDASGAYIQFDWIGLGASAQLVTSPRNGMLSCDGEVGCLTSAGTSISSNVATPEPASLALFGVGARVLGLVRRRRS